QSVARLNGLELTEAGLSRDGQAVPCPEERDIYGALGLPFIEPEMREGRGEIEMALRGDLPALVTDADVRGVLHSHTDASDGTATLEEMADACIERGYSYFGVCDHSQSAFYAGGMKEDRLRRQH